MNCDVKRLQSEVFVRLTPEMIKGAGAVYVEILPEDALWILERNLDRNRMIKSNIVKNYADDMLNDRWMLSGDAVRFDSCEQLIDGQHRLRACIHAKKSFRTLVILGLDPRAMDVIDSGAKRSTADVLRLNGFSLGKPLAGALKLVSAWESNRLGKAGNKADAVSNLALLETAARHPNLIAAFDLPFMKTLYVRRVMGQAIAGFTFYLLSMGDPLRANAFFDAFASGAKLDHGNPIMLLRERLSRPIMIAPRTKERLSTEEKIALVFLTWNEWVSGNTPKKLIVRKAKLSQQGTKRRLGLLQGAFGKIPENTSGFRARDSVEIPMPIFV